MVRTLDMCVCVCVCACVRACVGACGGRVWAGNFFVNDFSGTTRLRILKLGTNIGYDLLYCGRENQVY